MPVPPPAASPTGSPAATASASAAAPAASTAGKPLRIAVVMPSATTDLAFSQSMWDALKKIQAEMGGESAVELKYSENMFKVPDAAAALRDPEPAQQVRHHARRMQPQVVQLALQHVVALALAEGLECGRSRRTAKPAGRPTPVPIATLTPQLRSQPTMRSPKRPLYLAGALLIAGSLSGTALAVEESNFSYKTTKDL